ncbi:LytR/AlgR family response regulator transcription factor [Aquimarina sp. W85]|uniref:LytR/AlgR family response regulator transcription factor n=1 Tax=Aquimarina rhodophyticola TaxID=3342246 RepID=UPI003670B925
MKQIRTIIIDNNPEHAALLDQTLLKKYDNIVISSTATTLRDAKENIKKDDYDIIILNVMLENECTFESLSSFMHYANERELIILSHTEKYALNAFEYGATDFVIVPVTSNAITKAIDKAIKNILLKDANISQGFQSSKKPLEIIAISNTHKVDLIPVNEIIYLKSEGKYTLFHTTKKGDLLSSKNLGEYEKLLSDDSFFRIHHSYIANIKYAINIQKKDGIYLEIPNKQFLPISKRKRESLYQYLGI